LLCYLDSLSYITCSSIIYVIYVVRPDELSKDIGLLCLQAYLSILLVHPKGGRLGDARVVTAYTSEVLGYAGSLRYDHAPRYCRGRRQVVTVLSATTSSSWLEKSPMFWYGVGVLKDVTTLTAPGSGHSP
jgi:hypothetical protein